MEKKQRPTRIYFASDLHLGIRDSRARERLFVRWLNTIQADATAIYLLGDLFDFWFEYKTVVPRGYVRLLGKLAALRDAGIPIYYFVGNHDLWMHDYLEKELDIPIYHQPIIENFDGKTFFIGHGDGLGPGDTGYKLMKKVFTNKICQFLFACLHPNIAIGIANYFSQRSRLANGETDSHFLGKEQEMLWQYCQKKSKEMPHINYFVFGHRHLPLTLDIKENTTYINLGDWIKHNSYAIFDGQKLTIQYFS